METATKQTKNHKIELENHKLMSVTGVLSVPTFTDKNVTVQLDKEKLLIVGHDLSVKNLDIENGKLSLTGFVTALKYTTENTPKTILNKIFK
ncbi:MAG: YabP/YqfC family sporulation protein [Clostridia bacterium]